MNIVKIRFYNKLSSSWSNQYTCEDGAVLNDELNETLDSGSVVIKKLTEVLDIQPLDKCELILYEDGEVKQTRYFLVNSWQRAITRQVNTKTYNYSITLVSETKELEGIPLPNLVITNDKGLSVLDYIKRYNNLYGHYSISDSSFSGFDNVCPNMRWNNPTLREVLNDLCLVNDCIIKLSNGHLMPVDISKKGSAYSSDYITYENTSQSLEDYTSEVRCSLGNAIDESASKITNDISYRNNEVAYFNSVGSDNAGDLRIKLKNPIIDLTNLKIVIPVKTHDLGTGANQYTMVAFDFTEYVKEAGVLSSMPTGRGSTYATDYSSDYAKNCAYYNRGGNYIQGFSTNGTNYFIGKLNKTTVEIWKEVISRKLGYGGIGDLPNTVFIEDLDKWRFEVEYISSNSLAYQISRGTNYKRIRNPRVIFDNQDNSSIAIKKFINFENFKIDRLSNPISLIQEQNSPNFNDLAKLGQLYDDKVIYSTTKVIKRNSYNAEYYATPDYVLANYFTQMKSQKRNFEWVDESESVKRQEVKKIFYEFSFTQPTNQIDYKYLDYDVVPTGQTDTENYVRKQNIFASSPLIDCENSLHWWRDDSRNIKIITKESTQNNYNYSNIINVDGTMQYAKNIVNYSFQFDSNIFTGYRVGWQNADTSNNYPVSAWYNTGVKYTSNSEYNTFDSILLKLGGHTLQDEKMITFATNYSDLESVSNYYPREESVIAHEGLSLTMAFDVFKDNAEKFGASINFEWVSDNNDIEILEIAEKSLFALNKSSSLQQWIYDNTIFADIDLTNPITTGYAVDGVVGRGVYKKVDVYGVEHYYSDINATSEITEISNVPASVCSVFVYDLDTDSLLVETLINDYSTHTIQVELARSVKVGDIVYMSNATLGVQKKISGITNANVSLTNYNANALLSNSAQELKDCKCYKSDGTYISTLSYATANVNNDTGVIRIEPPTDCDYVVINEVIKIKNIQSHLVNNVVNVYLKLKDYYI